MTERHKGKMVRMRDNGASMDKWECSEGGRKDAGIWHEGGKDEAAGKKSFIL